MDRFVILLEELSHILHTPLHLDKKRACRLNINQIQHIQLEHDENRERILIATFVSEIPPGKYRENTLKEALKANNRFPRTGTFAYSERNNQLSLFEYIPLHELNAKKLADILAVLMEKGNLWRQAMERGLLPLASEGDPKVDSSLFQLKL